MCLTSRQQIWAHRAALLKLLRRHQKVKSQQLWMHTGIKDQMPPLLHRYDKAFSYFC